MDILAAMVASVEEDGLEGLEGRFSTERGLAMLFVIISIMLLKFAECDVNLFFREKMDPREWKRRSRC